MDVIRKFIYILKSCALDHETTFKEFYDLNISTIKNQKPEEITNDNIDSLVTLFYSLSDS